MSRKPRLKVTATAEAVPADKPEIADVPEAAKPSPMLGRPHGEPERTKPSDPVPGEQSAEAVAQVEVMSPVGKRIMSGWQVHILHHWRQASKADKRAFLKAIGVTPDLVN